MSAPAASDHQRTGSLYTGLAYGSVVLACFGGFFARQQYFTSERMVIVSFGLGAVFTALGVLHDCRERLGTFGYFALQSAVVTGIVFLSPIRGFMGIIVLPLVSQAIFDLRPHYAALLGLYLYGINVALWAIPYGWGAAWQAGSDYLTAFAFTIVFTIITKQAVGARIREEKLRQEVEAANRQLRESARQREELATTQERNRVAREIHDGVGHYLTVVKTQLDAAAGLLPAQPERARVAVVKAARLTGEALDDVRRSVGTLRSDTARAPLPEALRALAEEAGLPVAVRIEGEPRALAAAVEHALFRAAQEGLTNVRKHAQASAADVVLEFRGGGGVRLGVSDDGRGAQAAAKTGFGLVGMRERIELLGGRVESGSRAEGGYALLVEVPA